MLCVGATTPIMKSEKVELLEAGLRMQKRRFPFDVLRVETFTADGSRKSRENWRTIERMMAKVGKTWNKLKWLAQERS